MAEECSLDYDQQNKRDLVDGLLKMADIAEARDAYPADTGYKRAVAIAQAPEAQPQCILYDEPTTRVDPIMSDHLGDLLLRLKRGQDIFFPAVSLKFWRPNVVCSVPSPARSDPGTATPDRE